LKSIFQKIEDIDLPIDTSIIWGGDFNFVRNLDLETSGGNPMLKTGSIEQLQILLEEFDLCDIWRIRNQDKKRFTWNGKAQGKASHPTESLYRRLDFFYISDILQPMVQEADIIPAPATDHSAITLSIKPLPNSKHGPSFWKMNNSLLDDKNYVQMIRDLIGNTKNELKQNIFNPHMKWELMKYEIRKASMSFAKAKAKTSRNLYKEIENKIKEIEQKNDWEHDESLSYKHEHLRQELNKLSDQITNGIIMRSKATWFEQGEKSSKYFLTLEKKRKSTTLEGDKEITNPSEILKKLENFYSDMFSAKSDLSEEQCANFLNNLETPRINDQEKESCEGLLANKECYESVKEMGNNKTPGMDGLSK